MTTTAELSARYFTLTFTRDAAGSYSATSNDGTRHYSVVRLTPTRWVATMGYTGQAPRVREEARTMAAAKTLAVVRELAEQGRTGEALELKATLAN